MKSQSSADDPRRSCVGRHRRWPTPAHAAGLASRRLRDFARRARTPNEPAERRAPVAASGLIAYEFRGSACEGYASNFRQLTELQRTEGERGLVRHQRRHVRGRRRQVAASSRSRRTPAARAQPPISGSAARAENGAIDVDLIKPGKEKVDIGRDILFPTQHIERIIASAPRQGGARDGGAGLRRLRHRQEGLSRR